MQRALDGNWQQPQENDQVNAVAALAALAAAFPSLLNTAFSEDIKVCSCAAA